MARWIEAAIAAAAVALTICGPVWAADQLTPEQQAELARLRSLQQSLHPQTGDVEIGPAAAKLHLGSSYYFLPADEAKRVLTEAWNNPSGSVGDVLGMIFPEGQHFWDDSWAAVVTFDPSGFVTDKDASSAKYDEMITETQSQEGDINARRKQAGAPPMHLVGWAQPPSYDKDTHTLVWARDIQFGADADHTLNYDLRVLGRRGVLSLNVVSTMSKLDQIRPAAQALRNTAVFDAGSSFEDYRPGADKAAGYGLAGLVAAGLGVVAVKKLGLLALGLVFLKKAAVVVFAAIAGAVSWVRRKFSRKPSRLAAASVGEPAPPLLPITGEDQNPSE